MEDMKKIEKDTLPKSIKQEDLDDSLKGLIYESVEPEKRDKLKIVEGLDHVIVFIPPERQDYKRFMQMMEQKTKSDAAKNFLINRVIVYPEVKDFNELLEEMPGYTESLITAAIRCVGVEPDATAKKF